MTENSILAIMTGESLICFSEIALPRVVITGLDLNLWGYLAAMRQIRCSCLIASAQNVISSTKGKRRQ